MGLHDTDKTGNNRSNPTPNSNDTVTNPMAAGTTQNQNSGEEATADGLKFLERQIIAKQDGFNKAAFGFYGIANKFGLKVAEDGVDVLNATNDQLVFNSEQNVFKIADSGVVTLNKGANIVTASVTIPHSLGITPMCIAAVDYGGGAYYALPLTGINGGNGTIVNHIDFITDDEEVVFQVLAPTANSAYPLAQSFSIKYYLLQETAN